MEIPKNPEVNDDGREHHNRVMDEMYVEESRFVREQNTEIDERNREARLSHYELEKLTGEEMPLPSEDPHMPLPSKPPHS